MDYFEMRAAITRMSKRLYINYKIWYVIVFFIAAITGIAIADEKWIYFSIVLIPFMLYLCIANPFIFPFGAYVFLIPFDSVLSLAGSTQGATLTKVLGILTILVLSIKGAFDKKLKKPDAASLLWVLFFAYGFLSILWTIDPERTQSRIDTAIGLLLLYLVVSSYQFRMSEYETLKWCIIAGGFFAASYTIYIYTSGGLEEIGNRATMGVMDDERRYVSDPNRYAFSLIIPFSIGVKVMLDQKSKLIKGLICISFSLIIYAILLTGSRGGMFGIGIAIIVYALYMRQRISFVTILIVIAIILMTFLPIVFYERWEKAIDSGGGWEN